MSLHGPPTSEIDLDGEEEPQRRRLLSSTSDLLQEEGAKAAIVAVVSTIAFFGIATALISRLSDHARALECTEIWVVADPTDMAEGFYQSLGWARTGDRLAMFTRSLATT